jgi:hypothetical protein
MTPGSHSIASCHRQHYPGLHSSQLTPGSTPVFRCLVLSGLLASVAPRSRRVYRGARPLPGASQQAWRRMSDEDTDSQVCLSSSSCLKQSEATSLSFNFLHRKDSICAVLHLPVFSERTSQLSATTLNTPHLETAQSLTICIWKLDHTYWLRPALSKPALHTIWMAAKQPT